MADLLEALGFLFALVVAAGVATWLVILRSLRRANRVVEGRRSNAPLAWLWSVRQPARLHRRLRRAIQVATGCVPSFGDDRQKPRRSVVRARGQRPGVGQAATALHDVAADLVRRALAADDALVAACRLTRPWAQPRMAELSAEVREIEALAFRLVQLSGQWQARLDGAVQPALAPPDLRERLDAVEAALRELPIGV